MLSNRGFVEAILLVTVLIWGINTPAMKVGLLYLPPMAYNALRLLVAMLVFLPVLCSKKHCRPVAKEDKRMILAISLMGFFFFQVFFLAGLPKTSAGNAAMVLALLPVSVALINKFFHLETISRPVVAGIGVSLFGVVLIVLGSGKHMSLAANDLEGALLLLVGLAGNGYYTVFSKKLVDKYSSYQIMAYVMTITALAFAVISLPALTALNWSRIPLPAWLSILYSGVLGLSIGNFLWVWAIGRIGSTKAALYNNLSPVFAIFASWILLGETFGPLQIAGAMIIFSGLYLTRIKSRTDAATAKSRNGWMSGRM
ncbi:Hypothetical protein LUCI_2252 [Lucifera butyrica]|uniref:EamA domain-containing protein n=1 Tax=Lucifera butyrica TaxID=1351585 RepID=A0A498RCW9_9FIRM|nr:DMT family transporter [Lucifera butyrica]VBB07008.1 Hypothetical protein LUCI_2252 [Lucifera butyrica]